MYQKAYDEASAEEKNAYKEQLDEFKRYMEQSAESDRYTVSPAYIQRYQDVILPALYIGKPTVLDSTDNTSGLKTLVQRYIDGQITLDQFIREADGKRGLSDRPLHPFGAATFGVSCGLTYPFLG